jgi:hypothetical protein
MAGEARGCQEERGCEQIETRRGTTMGDRRFGLGGFLVIASIVAPVSVLPLNSGTWLLQLAAFTP